MNKTLGTIALSAGLAIGGFSVAQVASAQSDPPEASDPPVETPEETEADETPDGSESSDEKPDCDHRRGRGHHRPFADKDAIAEAIGIEPEEIRAGFEDGLSLAEIAEANGVDPQAVIDVMVENLDERLAQAVENGRLTQEEADERRENAVERITERVNTPPGEHERRPHRWHQPKDEGDADAAPSADNSGSVEGSDEPAAA